MVLGLKPMGKLATPKKKLSTRQKPRSCMVLGLKPMGKLATSKKKLNTRQNQGQTCGETNYFQEKSKH